MSTQTFVYNDVNVEVTVRREGSQTTVTHEVLSGGGPVDPPEQDGPWEITEQDDVVSYRLTRNAQLPEGFTVPPGNRQVDIDLSGHTLSFGTDDQSYDGGELRVGWRYWCEPHTGTLRRVSPGSTMTFKPGKDNLAFFSYLPSEGDEPFRVLNDNGEEVPVRCAIDCPYGIFSDVRGGSFTVRNGSVRQIGTQPKSTGVATRYREMTVDSVTVVMQGAFDSRGVASRVGSSPKTVTMTGTTVDCSLCGRSSNRNRVDYACAAHAANILGCTVIGGPHVALLLAPDASCLDSRVTANSIQTNGFAVLGQGGERVGGLDVDGHGRGIAPGSNSVWEDVLIDVEEINQNLEYGGVVIGGCYGIQIEKHSEILLSNISSTVTARLAEASALRIGGSGGGSTRIVVRDCTFTAVSEGLPARILKFTDDIAVGDVQFENCRAWTNDAVVLGMNNAHVSLEGMALVLEPKSPAQPEITDPSERALFFGGYQREDGHYMTIYAPADQYGNLNLNVYRERRYPWGLETRATVVLV